MALYSRITNSNVGPNPLREYNLIFECYKPRYFKGYSGFSVDFDINTRTLNIRWKNSDLPGIYNTLTGYHFLYIPIDVEMFDFIRTKYNLLPSETITVNIGNKEDYNGTNFDIMCRYKIMVLLVGEIGSDDIENDISIKTIHNVKFNFPDTTVFVRDYYSKHIKVHRSFDRNCDSFLRNYTTCFKLVCDSNIRFENCKFVNNGYDQILFGVNMRSLLQKMKEGLAIWALDFYELLPVTDEKNYVCQSLLDGNNIFGGSHQKNRDVLLDLWVHFDFNYDEIRSEEKRMVEALNNNQVLQKFTKLYTNNRVFLNSNLGLYQAIRWSYEDAFTGLKYIY